MKFVPCLENKYTWWRREVGCVCVDTQKSSRLEGEREGFSFSASTDLLSIWTVLALCFFLPYFLKCEAVCAWEALFFPLPADLSQTTFFGELICQRRCLAVKLLLLIKVALAHRDFDTWCYCSSLSCKNINTVSWNASGEGSSVLFLA